MMPTMRSPVSGWSAACEMHTACRGQAAALATSVRLFLAAGPVVAFALFARPLIGTYVVGAAVLARLLQARIDRRQHLART